MTGPDVTLPGHIWAHSTTCVLEGGQLWHLLDRLDDRVQPVKISVKADIVARQAVNRGGGVNTAGKCGIARCHTFGGEGQRTSGTEV